MVKVSGVGTPGVRENLGAKPWAEVPVQSRSGPSSAPGWSQFSPSSTQVQPKSSPSSAPSQFQSSPSSAPVQPHLSPSSVSFQPQSLPYTSPAPVQPQFCPSPSPAQPQSKPSSAPVQPSVPWGRGRGFSPCLWPRLRPWPWLTLSRAWSGWFSMTGGSSTRSSSSSRAGAGAARVTGSSTSVGAGAGEGPEGSSGAVLTPLPQTSRSPWASWNPKSTPRCSTRWNSSGTPPDAHPCSCRWESGLAGALGGLGGALGGSRCPIPTPLSPPIPGSLHQHRVHAAEERGGEGGPVPHPDRHLRGGGQGGPPRAPALRQLPGQGVQGIGGRGKPVTPV